MTRSVKHNFQNFEVSKEPISVPQIGQILARIRVSDERHGGALVDTGRPSLHCGFHGNAESFTARGARGGVSSSHNRISFRTTSTRVRRTQSGRALGDLLSFWHHPWTFHANRYTNPQIPGALSSHPHHSVPLFRNGGQTGVATITTRGWRALPSMHRYVNPKA